MVAAPTLVRSEPGPIHRIVGDLSDERRVLAGLGIRGDIVNAKTQPDRMQPDKSQPDTIDSLRARLAEAEETLRAIWLGEVDAIVVSGPSGIASSRSKAPRCPIACLSKR